MRDEIDDPRFDALEGQDRSVSRDIAGAVSADRVSIRQGAAGEVSAQHVDVRQGAVVVARAGAVRLESSAAGAVFSEEDAVLDMSIAGVVAGRGEVALDQCAAGVVAGRDVYSRDTNAVFVVAGRLDGKVNSAFGRTESLIFGAAAGLVIGGLLLLPRLFGSPKTPPKKSRS